MSEGSFPWAIALLVQVMNHKWAESVWCMSRMGMGMGIEFVFVCFSLDSAANEHLYSPPLIDHPLSSRGGLSPGVSDIYASSTCILPNSLRLQVRNKGWKCEWG